MRRELDRFSYGHVESLLPAYHNGTLGTDDQALVSAHLTGCATCRADSTEWEAIASASRSLWGSVGTAPTISPFTSLFQPPLTIEQHPLSDGVRTMSAPSTTAHPLRQAQRHRAFTQAALIAIVLAVLVGVIGIRPPGDHSSERPSIPAVAFTSNGSPEPAATTAPASASSPATEIACAIAPADLDRIDLTGETSTDNAITPSNLDIYEGPATSMDWRTVPIGDPATQAETEGITATVEEYIACTNASETARASALFSDDYWKRRNYVGATISKNDPVTFISLGGQSRELPLEVPSVENAFELPDGRVGAELHPPTGLSYELLIFVSQNGNWFIDEAMHVFKRSVIDLAVDDTGFSKHSLLATEGKTELELTNNGTRTHSFVIPELLIDITLEPGETENATIVYQEATLDFYSDSPGDDSDGFTGIVTIDFPDIATPTPVTPEAVASTCTIDAADASKLQLTGSTNDERAIPRPLNADLGGITEIDTSLIPLGSLLAPEQQTPIEEVIAALAACVNNGSPLQAAALFSDDYFRRLNADGVTANTEDITTFVPLQLPASGMLRSIPELTEVISLPDGRIGARLQVSNGDGTGNFQYEYYIFINVDGSWKVDEAVYVGYITDVTITIDDNGFEPSQLAVPMDTIRLTVVNNGTRVHNLTFVESSADYAIQPGATEVILFGPGSPGALEFVSSASGDDPDVFSGAITFEDAYTTPEIGG